MKKLGLKIQQVGSNILTFRTMKFTHKTKCLTENLKQFRMAWKLRAELKYLAHTNTNFCRKNDLDSIFRSYLNHSECCILQWFCKCVKLNFFDNIYKKISNKYIWSWIVFHRFFSFESGCILIYYIFSFNISVLKLTLCRLKFFHIIWSSFQLLGFRWISDSMFKNRLNGKI